MTEFNDRSRESLVADSETAHELVTSILEPAADYFNKGDFTLSDASSLEMRRVIEVDEEKVDISFSAFKGSCEHDYLDEVVDYINYRISVVTYMKVNGQTVAENWDFYIDNYLLEPQKEVYWEYLDDEGVVTDTEYLINEESFEAEFDPDEAADDLLRTLEVEMCSTFSQQDIEIIINVVRTLGFTDFEA